MNNQKIFEEGIDKILNYKRNQKNMTGWFLYQEIKMQVRQELESQGGNPDAPENQPHILCECIKRIPLSIPEGSVIAGTQDDAFSPSYALINPSFKVETFAGYCDPVAVYDDLKPNEEFTEERINRVRSYYASTPYVKRLNRIYEDTGLATREVAFFVEPVTGHMIPDCRPILAKGVRELIKESEDKTPYVPVMKKAVEAVIVLAHRYAKFAEELMLQRKSDKNEVSRLKKIAEACKRVPEFGARNLHEAVQSFVLLWQLMCLEQAPNPYAFSAGNIDRVFQPYLKDISKEEAVLLIRHLLAFFMVGNRCWAISQNILIGGMDEKGNDLSNDMTYIILDAFYQSNCPQPALSVKLHKHSPDSLYKTMGRFFFTPGHSTPSLFNDNTMFNVLRGKGISEDDLKDYAVAGCQEPLIMGRENGNTTNSWLNLAKILELTINNGSSLISSEKIGLSWEEMGYKDLSDVLDDLENAFWKQLDYFLKKMSKAANACTENLATVATPFGSVLYGGFESGYDMRDISNPGTKYNGSGCLIHGLSVITDSFTAVKKYLQARIASPEDLLNALKNDFKGYEQIGDFLLSQDKYGNNIKEIDRKAAYIVEKTCEKIKSLKNPSGNSFQPDFSTPSTHLLYGYWVGATPDGRHARKMLGYGIDPRVGAAVKGFQERIISNKCLPFNKISGGYASHIGLSNNDFSSCEGLEEKGLSMKEKIIAPLFSFNSGKEENAPYYAYFNVDDASHLRKVLKEPEKYAPSGIYIMRIHGTFVNFLDLSPAIQEDIIERLDPASSKIA